MKKVFVANIAFTASNDELQTFFEKAGNVVSCKIITDQETGRSKGFGFVEFSSDSEAQEAINQLNDADFCGRPLVVREADDRRRSSGGGGGNRRYDGGGGRRQQSYREED